MRLKILSIVLAVLVISAGVWAGEEKAWYDLKTCAFCKNFDLGNGEYIVDHMKGEYHNLPNGILGVMTIEEEYKEACEIAHKAIEQVAVEMQKTGKVPNMCGHCTAYGELLQTAKETVFESEIAEMYMMTSDDPEVVNKLHAFAERNRVEMAKWYKERAAAKVKKAGQ